MHLSVTRSVLGSGRYQEADCGGGFVLTGNAEVTELLPACRQYGQNRPARCYRRTAVLCCYICEYPSYCCVCLQASACRYEIMHGNIPCCMTANNLTSQYALGSTEAEHKRLIRQAAWLTVHTERLFREAGIGPGQRVLDLGSGVGDVSLIAARLVGPSG